MRSRNLWNVYNIDIITPAVKVKWIHALPSTSWHRCILFMKCLLTQDRPRKKDRLMTTSSLHILFLYRYWKELYINLIRSFTFICCCFCCCCFFCLNPKLISLFVAFRSVREYFAHVKTSSLLVQARKIWTERNLYWAKLVVILSSHLKNRLEAPPPRPPHLDFYMSGAYLPIGSTRHAPKYKFGI